MTKRLTKHGNSWAIVVEKPVLELLGIDSRTVLDMRTDGQSLIITPQSSRESRKQQFEDALSETNRLYGGMLERLAK